MKHIGRLIKLLPLLTLAWGLFSGGARMGPFLDTAKVALTQYELGQIAKLVYEDLERPKGPVIEPDEFSKFLRNNFHSQYSVLAREIRGDKTHDHAIDIWGRPFRLDVDRLAHYVKISSLGPDGVYGTKDDIAADITYESGEKIAAKEARPRPVPIPAPEVAEPINAQPPAEDDLYDRPDPRDVVEVDERMPGYEEVDQREPAAQDEPYADERGQTH